MPTSITVVATSTSAPPAANARHRLLLLARAHLAVQQHDAVVLELAAAQALVLGGRGARLQRLGLLDQRADDERLAAGVELLADALVGARALGVGAGDVGRRSGAGRPGARAGRSRRGRRRRSARACAGSASRSCAGCAAPGPAGALRSSARRWLTPKRCCSSTTATASRSNSTASSISAWVPTSSFSSPLRELAEQVGAAAAGREPVSSAACTSSPGISFCSVAKCCSASVSVGAISAAWPPDSTARSIAYSATTVLPEPTSPISSRCIGRSLRDVVVDRGHGGALVAGRRERQRVRAASAP